jgi:hypothetical protein
MREVAQRFPNTPSAAQAAGEIAERFQKEMKAVAPVDGKPPVERFDALRQRYPEFAATVDKIELDVHRARVLQRSERLAAVMKSDKGEIHETLRDFVPPEAIRRQGEAPTRFWARAFVGMLLGLGTRFKEIDIQKDTLKIEVRKTATLLSKVLLVQGVRQERKNTAFVVEWTWFEDDWYLGENSVREEK